MRETKRGIYLSKGEQLTPEQSLRYNANNSIYVNWDQHSEGYLKDLGNTECPIFAQVIQLGPDITRLYIFNDSAGYPSIQTFVDRDDGESKDK